METMQFGSSVFLILTVLYLGVQTYAVKRAARTSQLRVSDDDYLASLAMARQCSAYDIFLSAGEVWNFSKSKTQVDFNTYLRSGHIPHYVAGYSRKNTRLEDLQAHQLVSRRW